MPQCPHVKGQHAVDICEHMLAADNLRKGWASLFALGKHSGGQKTIASAMNLCHGVPLKNDSHVTALAQWLQEAWDYMAMVLYRPCPSSFSYLTDAM